jgi:hypothetical protein
VVGRGERQSLEGWGEGGMATRSGGDKLLGT